MSPVRIVLAADIAEMLCADMKKEGLCGRTLTLKLKTASFEVLSDSLFCCLLYEDTCGQIIRSKWINAV